MTGDPLDVLRGSDPDLRPDPEFVARLRNELLTRADRDQPATGSSGPTAPSEPAASVSTDAEIVEIDMNRTMLPTRRRPVLIGAVAAAAALVIGIVVVSADRDRDTTSGPADSPVATTTSAPAASTLTPVASVASVAIAAGPAPWTMTAAGGSLWVVNSPGTGLERRDATTGALLSTIAMSFDVYADPARADSDSLWVATEADGKVRRIQLATGEVVATIDIPDGIKPVSGDEPAGIAVDDRGAWVVSGGIERTLTLVDRATNTVTSRFPLTVPHPADLAVGFGSLWVTDGDGQLHRIDPTDGRIIASVPLATATGLLAVDETAVWVLGPDQASGTTVQRIDPTTNAVVATIAVSSRRPEIADLAAGNGQVWVRATPADARLVLIDSTTNQIVARYSGLTGGEGITLTDDAVWTLSASDRTLYRLPRQRP